MFAHGLTLGASVFIAPVLTPGLLDVRIPACRLQIHYESQVRTIRKALHVIRGDLTSQCENRTKVGLKLDDRAPNLKYLETVNGKRR